MESLYSFGNMSLFDSAAPVCPSSLWHHNLHNAIKHLHVCLRTLNSEFTQCLEFTKNRAPGRLKPPTVHALPVQELCVGVTGVGDDGTGAVHGAHVEKH